MSWWSRLSNAVRHSHLDEDLDEEQRFQIESRAGDLEALGLPRREALAQASRQFGHRLQLRETTLLSIETRERFEPPQARELGSQLLRRVRCR